MKTADEQADAAELAMARTAADLLNLSHKRRYRALVILRSVHHLRSLQIANMRNNSDRSDESIFPNFAAIPHIEAASRHVCAARIS